MGNDFPLRGLRLIRSKVVLDYAEFQLLEYLIERAEQRNYWDSLLRARAHDHVDLMLQNIIMKTRWAGLEEALKRLKEEVDAEEPVV
jgi:endonuclease III-like uncharacterized protein